MRVLHTGDWHLGRTLEGRSRQAEQEQFIDELVQIVRDYKVDLILMAGDVYDSVNPPAIAEKLFYEACARLTAEGSQLVIIAGNHDQPERVAAASPLVAEKGISLLGLPVAAPIYVNIARTNEQAIIAALPYPSESRLSELLSLDENEQALRVQYSAKVGKLMKHMAQHFKADTINLAMSHIYVLGGLESDSERPIQVGRMPPPGPGAGAGRIDQNPVHPAGKGFQGRRVVGAANLHVAYPCPLCTFNYRGQPTVLAVIGKQLPLILHFRGQSQRFATAARAIVQHLLTGHGAHQQTGDLAGFILNIKPPATEFGIIFQVGQPAGSFIGQKPQPQGR